MRTRVRSQTIPRALREASDEINPEIRMLAVAEALGTTLDHARERLGEIPDDLPVQRRVRTEVDRLRTSLSQLREQLRRTRRKAGVTGALAVDDLYRQSLGRAAMEVPEATVRKEATHSIDFPKGMFRLCDVLQMLAAHQKTGLVRVTTDDETLEIKLRDGGAVSARSIDGPVEDRLGEILVRRGVLSRSQLEIVLVAVKKGQAKLGAAVRELLGVGNEALRDAIHDQLQRLFQRALSAREAAIRFEESEDETTAARGGLSIMSIMLEALAASETPRD